MKPELQYAGFWRRLLALFLDSLFISPLFVLVWLNLRVRLFQPIYIVPSVVFSLFYSVYLVKRFGGTPGKIVAGIRIVRLDGSALRYREAVLRFLPELLSGTLISAGIALAALKMSDAEFSGMAMKELGARKMALAPFWVKPIQLFQQVWIISEFIVLLTNERKRALHDYIAGTIVILRKPHQTLQTNSGNVPTTSAE